jgi:signal transduction histidine kinase
MTALRARKGSAQTGAEVEQLLTQMREANERLFVAAVHAQNQSDEAHAEAARARAELDDLINRLRDANERLATAAAHAQMMATEADARQEEYRQLSSRLLTLQDEERRRLALDLHDSTAQRLAALTPRPGSDSPRAPTSNADHGQAQSPLDERARALRDP